MPITPDEARASRREKTADTYQTLDDELQKIAREDVDTGRGLTLQLGNRPRDVVERVLADWRKAGWPEARIVNDQREGDYISLR